LESVGRVGRIRRVGSVGRVERKGRIERRGRQARGAHRAHRELRERPSRHLPEIVDFDLPCQRSTRNCCDGITPVEFDPVLSGLEAPAPWCAGTAHALRHSLPLPQPAFGTSRVLERPGVPPPLFLLVSPLVSPPLVPPFVPPLVPPSVQPLVPGLLVPSELLVPSRWDVPFDAAWLTQLARCQRTGTRP
jgi:hypothetical protein